MEKVCLEEILQYALRAQLSYKINQPGWDITEKLGWRKCSPHRIHIEEVPKVNINVIVELNDDLQVQWIAVRGTENLENWFLDGKYIQEPCSKKFAEQTLNIDLHSGFYQASTAVWNFIQENNYLNRNYKTRITGHSLGGAIAAILMMFIKNEGYSLEKCITFGQPKITNSDGAKKAAEFPLLRVINQEDLVTAVPPKSLLNRNQSQYFHFGPEVQLQPSTYVFRPGSYVFRSEHNERYSTEGFCKRDIGDFWKRDIKDILGDIKDHYMQYYLDNIASNLESSKQKEKYLLNK